MTAQLDFFKAKPAPVAVELVPRCLLCGEGGSGRVFSSLAAMAFGQENGSVHSDCVEEIMRSLRKLTPDPLEWVKMLQDEVPF